MGGLGRSKSRRIGILLAPVILCIGASCGGSSAPRSASSSPSTHATTTTTTIAATTTTAAVELTNCDLLSPSEVGTQFKLTMQRAIETETGLCRYTQVGGAPGDLNFSVSFKSPGGRSAYESFRSLFTFVPSPSQVQAGTETAVDGLGGDRGFFAAELGGNYDWATESLAADTYVSLQVGGQTFLNGITTSAQATQLDNEITALMKLALQRATQHTKAPAS